ncbi:MAG TPA: M14 family zinc carboxypeptidase [Phycisphaerae bacterium]|nr:M14 family zinc carboxypeptidase [Phycisphaerae bacterium]
MPKGNADKIGIALAVAMTCGVFQLSVLKAATDAAAPLSEKAIAVDVGSDDASLQKVGQVAIRQAFQDTPYKAAIYLQRSWAAPMLAKGEYAELLKFAQMGIQADAYESNVVTNLQAARVRSLLALGQNDEALAKAKSLYLVANMDGTGTAIQLVAKCLASTKGEASANAFLSEQSERTVWRAKTATKSPSILDDVKIDAIEYTEMITDQRRDYKALAAKGNLLLLAGDCEGASKAFDAARGVAEERYQNSSAENVARAIKASYMATGPANEFVMSLRPSVPMPEKSALIPFALTHELSDPPPLELKREALTIPPGSSKIDSQFDGGYAPKTRKIAEDHFSVDFSKSRPRMFIFHVTGVKGKTVRMDLLNVADYWSCLNPVYTYASDPSALVDLDETRGSSPTIGYNGTVLPTASDGGTWHFVSDVWTPSQGTLSFVLKFDEDSAYVAMKVPYFPAYNDRYLDSLHSPFVSTLNIGKSAEGRRLTAVKITEASVDAARSLPTILIYAREHSDEHDASWLARGAIDWLLSQAGVNARQHAVFLIIPLLDPDAAVHNVHESVIETFSATRQAPESVAYSAWLEHWVNDGNRLDFVLSLHSQEAGEPGAAHLMSPAFEAGARKPDFVFYQAEISRSAGGAGFDVDTTHAREGTFPLRFGGWAENNFGAFSTYLETNSQERFKHLRVEDLCGLGGVVAQKTESLLTSPDGQSIVHSVADVRAERDKRWKLYGAGVPTDNGITAEARYAWKARVADDEKTAN